MVSTTSNNQSEGDSSLALTPRQQRRLSHRPSDRAIIGTLAFSGLIVAFLQTLVTPVIPDLPRLLSTSTADASWVLTSTLLAATITTPISGRLGDMFGKRRVLLSLLAIMSVGSVISAFSDTLIPMVAGRVLQGIGLGVISLAISVLRDVIHPKALGGAVALISATLGIGGAIGLPISALIAQSTDWHYLFWLATALGIIAFILVFTIVPVSTLRTGGRFDVVGAIGLAIGLVGILLAISKGSTWGWSSPVTLSLLIGGVVVLLLWGVIELRTSEPLVDLRIAARRPVLLTNIASICVGFSFFVTTAALPTLLEAPTSTGVGLGQTLWIASLCLAPLGLVMFLVSSPAAKLSAAKGSRTSLILGGAIISVSFALALVLMTEVWHVILISTLVGIGVGLAYAAMPTLIMHAVPATETAAANALNSVMRSLGSTLAATLVGVILSSDFVLSNAVAIPTREAFQSVFAMATGVMLVGVIMAICLPRRETLYQTSSIRIQPDSAPLGGPSTH